MQTQAQSRGRSPVASTTPVPAGAATTPAPGTKLNLQRVGLTAPGDELIGHYVERRVLQENWLPKDAAPGQEPRDLAVHVFKVESIKFAGKDATGQLAGQLLGVYENAGLSGVIAECGLIRDQKVRLLFTGKEDLGGGRSVNQYDIFAA